MLKGEKKYKYRKFEYYLRQCDDCANLFKAKSKLSCYCSGCKRKRTPTKIKNSLKARGFDFKEVIDKLDKMVGVE